MPGRFLVPENSPRNATYFPSEFVLDHVRNRKCGLVVSQSKGRGSRRVASLVAPTTLWDRPKSYLFNTIRSVRNQGTQLLPLHFR